MEELDEAEAAAGRCGWGEMMSDMLTNDTVNAKVSWQEERVWCQRWRTPFMSGAGEGEWCRAALTFISDGC